MSPGGSSAEPGVVSADDRLLIVTSTFPISREDGSPRFVLDLAEELTTHFDVTVLAPAAPGAAEEETYGRVHVVRFTYFRPRRLQRLAYGDGMVGNLRRSLLAKLQVLPFLWSQTRALRRLVRERSIGWVNSHWLVPQGLTVGWVRGRRGRFRHLLHIHAADVYLLERLPLGRRLARFVIARTDAILADGSHVRKALDRLLGHPSGARLQPMGVRSEVFHPATDREPARSPFPGGHLAFVGRFVEKKGVVYLLRALPRIRERYEDLGLVLIGYGPLETALREESERLGVDAAVHFTGPLAHEKTVRFLQSCRVAVVPSIIDSRGETEGMPTVVVEAMAAGARVVASAVDGIPDVIRHGENGWLCRPRDPQDLAEKVMLALEDPQDSAITGEAISTGRDHDWRRIAERYRDELLGLGKPLDLAVPTSDGGLDRVRGQ